MIPGRNDRVVESHGIARAAFRAGGMFAAVAAVWAVVVLTSGGSWWGPIHAFLAGTVLLAISGASQMFTITWASAPPPPRLLTNAQRWLAIMGAAAALAGVATSTEAVVWAGATALAVSLVLLGWAIRRTVLASLLRRFDLSSRFYLVAFACGTLGMVLGGLLGSGVAGDEFVRVRLVHSHLNLVGLVGLTIVGTLPTFLPTVAHNRAVSGSEVWPAWLSAVGAAVAMTVGLWWGERAVGVGTLLAGASAAMILVGILVRLWEKGRSRLPFLQISAGVLWLCAWAVVDGIRLVGGSPAVPFSTWNGAVIVAGIAQVLAGSLAYLLPVVLGPPITANRDRMTAWPPLPLLAANIAGFAFVAGWTNVAAGATIVWALDFGRRLVFLRRQKPTGTEA